jgi:parafibromin
MSSSATDPLLLLRSTLLSSSPPILTTSDDPTTAELNKSDSLITATHLYFPLSASSISPVPVCLPLTTITRFKSQTPEPPTLVDLRSIYFAWQQKDETVPEYISRAAELDKELPEGQKLRNLVFVERIELIAWLEGASDEEGGSEFITPLRSDDLGAGDVATKAADVSSGATGAGGPAVIGGTGATAAASGRPVKVIDARLQEIYNGERKMGDRNTVLRGIKPTVRKLSGSTPKSLLFKTKLVQDFSHVRKAAEVFLKNRKPPPNPASSRPGQPPKPSSTQLANRPAAATPKPLAAPVSSKRQDPIILLSPSASSLLRLSNIKSFLDSGLFVPADHPTLSSQTTANLLHITRPLQSLDPSGRPYRFIIVDSPEQFKPDYWNRVVAVFTTGQVWQFRGYKWREPQELFGHVLGIYVGERGGPVPSEVKGWGSGVKSFFVDRWDERAHGGAVDQSTREGRRWRDREVVEEVWRTIEAYMRGKPEWRR